MFKINNKDIRTTPTAVFLTFTPFSRISIVNFQEVNAGLVRSLFPEGAMTPVQSFFYKQLASDLSPQSCYYFSRFLGFQAV